MLDLRPRNWRERPALVAGVAFVLGVGAAIAVVAIVLALRDGDDDGDTLIVRATVTATGTGTPGARGTALPELTLTPSNPRDPDDALASFIGRELDQRYIGPCPTDTGAGVPEGLCSIELYRSAELVTFIIGPPFSESTGEAVLTPGQGGVWLVEFVERTDTPLAVGRPAVVFGAGDCLNFRSAPGVGSEALSCQVDGASANVVGGPEQADGATWWQLDGLGWASAQYLIAR